METDVASSTSLETIEAWAAAYVLAPDIAYKLAPPKPPATFETVPAPRPEIRPGRGASFNVSDHAHKSSGRSALRSPIARARLIHTFLHHELQAAELMAWAILAFPSAPERLKRGLLGVLFDEVRHMNLYAELLRERGYEPGGFEVRDWFWERVPQAPSIESFLATMGLGFEGANLDHAPSFAERFRAAGDERAAEVEERIGQEEVPHVRFALTWFLELSPLVRDGVPLFDAFASSLPAPLSPMLMRGKAICRPMRARAGLTDDFVERLVTFGG
ncbi:MAG: DUF455 family protein [Polyangiaceae bacterium]|nr:DUF455 family protein [Polyangiaceae bacterium]